MSIAPVSVVHTNRPVAVLERLHVGKEVDGVGSRFVWVNRSKNESDLGRKMSIVATGA